MVLVAGSFVIQLTLLDEDESLKKPLPVIEVNLSSTVKSEGNTNFT